MPSESNIILAVIGSIGLLATLAVISRSNRAAHTYYTKTKTALSQKEIVIYEIFSPNSTKTVSLKLDNYQNVNSIDLDIVSAKVYN